MITSIQLEQETLEALQANAAAQGLTLSEYLQSFAKNRVVAPTPGTNGAAGTVAEFDALLDEFFEQNPRKLPSLPDIFSRGDIYIDHD